MPYFYVAVVTNENPPRIQFPEHYEKKEDRDQRAEMLKSECYTKEGVPWLLWTGDEPFEAVMVRTTTPPTEDEIPAKDDTAEQAQAKFDAYKARVDALAAKAAESTTSVLTDPPIDDVPLWYKLGYQNEAQWLEAQPAKKGKKS